MAITAKLNNLRLAPRKVRLVADLIRRKPARDAETILMFTVKRGSPIVLKLLRQAIANAKNNFHLDVADLYVSKITVDEGPKLKRWRPRARGSAAPIQKKTCHINLVLDSTKPVVKTGKVAKKAEAVAEKEIKENIKAEKKEIEKPKFKKDIKETLRHDQDKKTQRIFRRKAF